MATAPSSARATITSFEQGSTPIRTQGAATAHGLRQHLGAHHAAARCPRAPRRSAPRAVPHWTPATYGGNVPATPVTKLAWTALSTGTTPRRQRVSVSVPKAARDASGFDRLSVKLAADETRRDRDRPDALGRRRRRHDLLVPVSALNPLALNRLPASRHRHDAQEDRAAAGQRPDLGLADAGLDLADIREVRFAAATGADATRPVLPSCPTWPSRTRRRHADGQDASRTIDLAIPTVDEGNGPGTADLAVHLDAAAQQARSPATSRCSARPPVAAASTMEKVTFAPARPARSSRRRSSVTPRQHHHQHGGRRSVINTSGAVMGKNALGNLVVREDDGIVDDGDETRSPRCRPRASRVTRAPSWLLRDDRQDRPRRGHRRPGRTSRSPRRATASARVAVTLGEMPLGVGIGRRLGPGRPHAPVPADVPRRPERGDRSRFGHGLHLAGSIEVLTATATTLSMSPEIPEINQAVTLTAQVEGPDTAGTVEFFDGTTSLGSAT